MWLSKTMMVFETMDYHMIDILTDSPHIFIRTITEGNEPLRIVCGPYDQSTKENQKFVNLDVRAREAKCNSLPYKIYQMMEYWKSTKEMIGTLKVS